MLQNANKQTSVNKTITESADKWLDHQLLLFEDNSLEVFKNALKELFLNTQLIILYFIHWYFLIKVFPFNTHPPGVQLLFGHIYLQIKMHIILEFTNLRFGV